MPKFTVTMMMQKASLLLFSIYVHVMVLMNSIHLSLAICEDIDGSFPVTTIPWLIGKKKTCKWVSNNPSFIENRCQYNEVKEACPVTCGLCGASGDDSLLENAEECVDNTERFLADGLNRKCKWVLRRSSFTRCQSADIQANCPYTCDPDCLVPSGTRTECRDSLIKFQLINGKKKNCEWVRKKQTTRRCRKYPARIWCPFTCESCGTEPSVSPTTSVKPSWPDVPTQVPTSNPSSKPSWQCFDFVGKFYVQEVLRNKDCDWVGRQASWRCTFTGVGEKCPITCGTCQDAPSMSPSTSSKPSRTPSSSPSLNPSSSPTDQPSRVPSSLPSLQPSNSPSTQPSRDPSSLPSMQPSRDPSSLPSLEPSREPSMQPSRDPSAEPSHVPSITGSDPPSMIPSTEPSMNPSSQPSCIDDPNWANGDTTCAGFPEIFCDLEIGNFIANDKTASDACCVCGGSIMQTVEPSLTPSVEPSQQPSDCLDVDGWTVTLESLTFTCANFEPGSNCAALEEEDSNGYTATQACCACGGGVYTLP